MTIRILGAGDVAKVLARRPLDTIEAVRTAYLAHAAQRTIVPHSLFLRPPSEDGRRYIALPAYLDDGTERSGLKWIGSYPGNVAHGRPRASSVIILNSPATGYPEVVLEGAAISAARTGASAALATTVLRPNWHGRVGLVGAGPINRSVLRYLAAADVPRGRVQVCDLDNGRADRFVHEATVEFPRLTITATGDVASVLAAHEVVSIATNALTPHVASANALHPQALVLHLSLRDLAPAVMHVADNVVDDADHVLRERTSLHLASADAPGKRLVRAELGDILAGRAEARPTEASGPTVFSPFGLGVLDLAVAQLVERDDPAAGTVVPDFQAA
jgi:2,3-diaminopropionate biosynthesis protein SbnB